jgi:glycosyltransferase involved in cell wall biosynthesis
MNPQISVIIPCRNATNYLAEAVMGIRKQNMPVEIIVVDDGSTDDTVKIAENMGCHVIRHEKTQGQVAGKNTGLKAARGEYIMFHDHDDIMTEGTLSVLCRELTGDKNLFLVMAKVVDFISSELDDNEKIKIKVKVNPYYGLFSGAVLMRRKLFDIVGLFDERLNTGEIISLFVKMDEFKLMYAKIDMVASNRRIHNTNYGRTDAAKEKKDYLKVLRNHITTPG